MTSCYEAGRDGFQLHRFLLAHGIANQLVDSSAIDVSRRRRRAKSDGLDASKLVNMLIRYHQGEDKVWQVPKVPSVVSEAGPEAPGLNPTAGHRVEAAKAAAPRAASPAATGRQAARVVARQIKRGDS